MRLSTSWFFLGALLGVSAGAHWAAASWAMRVFPSLARRRRAVKIAVTAVVVLMPVLRVLTRRTHSVFLTEMLTWMTFELMTLLFGVIPLMIIVALSQVVPRRRGETSTHPEEDSKTLGRREVLQKVGGIATFGATSAVLGWGMTYGRHEYLTEEVVVRIPGLPKALDGYTIAQVSDIHAGTFMEENDLRRALSLVAPVRPDLIVATGDLVDYDSRYAPMLARALSDLRARDGVVAILGNHDYYTGADEVSAALARERVRLLLNEGMVVRPNDGGGFALLGVDDSWGRRSGGPGPDLSRAIGMVPPDLCRILLAHQPNFLLQSAGKVALQLSGHTHGGQVNPGFRPAAAFIPYLVGRYERGGSTLYVNRGFGVAGPPVRIGSPPEITKIVLVG
jgi:predicted MPP superfamily phosphohydrolase